MTATNSVSRLAPYLEQLLENENAQESLRRGADKLRDAYERSQKPKKRRSRWPLALLTLGAIGAGVAIATNDELRASLLGSGSPAATPEGGEG